MHEHMTLQDFILSVFSIGTPFCICCYCCYKCTNKYYQVDNDDGFEEWDENELPPLPTTQQEEIFSDSDEEEYNTHPSPRTIRVIEKYGHYKPDYSGISSSEYSSDIYTTSDENESDDEEQ